MKKIIPVAVMALLTWGLLKLNTVAKLIFAIKKISFDGNILSPSINLTLSITNSLNNSILVNSITGKLYVNEIYLGNVNMNNPTKINGNGISEINVRLDMVFDGLLNTISAIFSSTKKITFAGKVLVDYVPIPIYYTTEL